MAMKAWIRTTYRSGVSARYSLRYHFLKWSWSDPGRYKAKASMLEQDLSVVEHQEIVQPLMKVGQS